MIVLKFQKTGRSALAAHVDTLRAITYTLRRANVCAEYSQGYNPHMELGFSPPLPLGVNSLAEYVSVKATYDEDLLNRLQSLCPQGMNFVKMWNLPVDVNVASKPVKADYDLFCSGIGGVIEEILASGYQITYTEKGNQVTKDVSSKIFAASGFGDTAKVTLSIGNDNLRPDRLVRHLMAAHSLTGDYSVTKTAAYTADGQNVDDWLDGLAK